MKEVIEIQRLLELPGLNDLVISGALMAQADFGDGLVEIENPFLSSQKLSEALSELALSAGVRLDIAKPIADFSLYGARFHAVLAQGVSPIPLVSIRKHQPQAITLEHLVQAQMLTHHAGSLAF